MGLMYRRRQRLGTNSRLNLSTRGASISKRVGRGTLSSRGGGRIRLGRGLSFRFGRRR